MTSTAFLTLYSITMPVPVAVATIAGAYVVVRFPVALLQLPSPLLLVFAVFFVLTPGLGRHCISFVFPFHDSSRFVSSSTGFFRLSVCSPHFIGRSLERSPKKEKMTERGREFERDTQLLATLSLRSSRAAAWWRKYCLSRVVCPISLERAIPLGSGVSR